MVRSNSNFRTPLYIERALVHSILHCQALKLNCGIASLSWSERFRAASDKTETGVNVVAHSITEAMEARGVRKDHYRKAGIEVGNHHVGGEQRLHAFKINLMFLYPQKGILFRGRIMQPNCHVGKIRDRARQLIC